ncbi:hypothetical protein GCM10023336_00950 [Streptomyces similanensis]|uniref:Uncharacterized protein n=1 Tax=Streptomyces similanensis TaxID=1274988 RepID=A0ABP9JQ01_9ACTN
MRGIAEYCPPGGGTQPEFRDAPARSRRTVTPDGPPTGARAGARLPERGSRVGGPPRGEGEPRLPLRAGQPSVQPWFFAFCARLALISTI